MGNAARTAITKNLFFIVNAILPKTKKNVKPPAINEQLAEPFPKPREIAETGRERV
jgi:hypothetical protein